MAEFFKEDLDKTQKNKEHGPGSLIKDLDNLGKTKEDDFLKGFPKTPAQVAKEKAEAEAKAEASRRAAEEMARVEAEEDKLTILEAEQEAWFIERAVRSASEMKSGQVKTKIESFTTQKTAIFDTIETIGREISLFAKWYVFVFRQLVFCFVQEICFMWDAGVFTGRKLRRIIKSKINVYYRKNPEKLCERQKKNRIHMRRFILAKNKFLAKEKVAAAKMVRFINHVDDKNEEWADKTNIMVKKGNKKVNFAREWAELNKRRLLMNFGVIVIAAICGVAVFNYCTAYEYAYNGRTLGTVERQEDVLKIVDIVSEQLSKEHSAEIYIDKERDITFKRIWSMDKEIDDTEAVLKRLTYMKNMNAKAYAIYINDVRAAIVDSKDTAKTILENMKSAYFWESDSVEYESVGFKEKIEVKQIDTKLGRIQNIDVAMQKLQTGAVFNQVHTVVAGDTLSGIAKIYNMTMADLKAANPTINPERLSIGQELTLTKPAPMLTIKSVEVATYPEPIAYETVYKDTKNLYKGETKTEVEGVTGERSVTARITRENGVQVAADVLNAKLVSEPTTAVIVRGTKVRPATVGTGNLKYPVSGYRLTSKFGSRWGRMHYGLDLACPTGTRIGAADGGTVIFSGYSGSYGYVVKINHGNGMVTVYAHCSKLIVKKGEKVYQGQHIANVGNTGRSTGPHCHFEVQINGTPKNPTAYL